MSTTSTVHCTCCKREIHPEDVAHIDLQEINPNSKLLEQAAELPFCMPCASSITKKTMDLINKTSN